MGDTFKLTKGKYSFPGEGGDTYYQSGGQAASDAWSKAAPQIEASRPTMSVKPDAMGLPAPVFTPGATPNLPKIQRVPGFSEYGANGSVFNGGETNFGKFAKVLAVLGAAVGAGWRRNRQPGAAFQDFNAMMAGNRREAQGANSQGLRDQLLQKQVDNYDTEHASDAEYRAAQLDNLKSEIDWRKTQANAKSVTPMEQRMQEIKDHPEVFADYSPSDINDYARYGTRFPRDPNGPSAEEQQKLILVAPDSTSEQKDQARKYLREMSDLRRREGAGGGGGQKPASKAQFATAERTKASALQQAESNYRKSQRAVASGEMTQEEADGQLQQDKQAAQNAYEAEVAVLGGEPDHYQYGVIGPQAAAPRPSGKPIAPKKALDATTTAAYLQKAGGDKNKARKLARQDGYEF